MYIYIYIIYIYIPIMVIFVEFLNSNPAMRGGVLHAEKLQEGLKGTVLK